MEIDTQALTTCEVAPDGAAISLGDNAPVATWYNKG